MEKGFTLIELLISVSLVALIATAGTGILTSIMRSYNKAQIIGEIEQNGSYALTVMESQIRNAKSVSPTGTSTKSLTVTTQEGSTVVFEIVSVGGTGVVRRTSGGATDILTNDDLVSGVDVVTAASSFTIGSTTPSVVGIALIIRQAPNAPGRVDYQAETTLRTSVVVRGGYD